MIFRSAQCYLTPYQLYITLAQNISNLFSNLNIYAFCFCDVW